MRWILITTLCLLPLIAAAQWPTDVKQDRPIAKEFGVWEAPVYAHPMADNRTFIVYRKEEVGCVYQILSHEGNYLIHEERKLAPDFPNEWYIYPYEPIPDGQGGVVVLFSSTVYSPIPGFYLQRIDPDGNILWGNSALNVFPGLGDQALCSDGAGGFYCAVSVALDSVRIQRITLDGNLLFGDEGILVCDEVHSQTLPEITSYSGGAYVVWSDNRPPYSIYRAIYMQKVDSLGNVLWDPEGVFICEGGMQLHEIIPDGEDGFILHVNTGGDQNTVFRIGPDGDILWSRVGVSYYYWAEIVAGEPGYFYLGFKYGTGNYAQKMDMNGHTCWPEPGAPFVEMPNGWHGVPSDFYYKYPYFYGVFAYYPAPSGDPGEMLFVQALDGAGRQLWGENGVKLSCLPPGHTGQYNTIHISPCDDGGAVGIYEHVWWHDGEQHDIFAKRCNFDGSLGGANTAERDYLPSINLSHSSNFLSFTLPTPSQVTIDLFNILGQQVQTISEGFRQAGTYSIQLDESNLASGVYLARLQVGAEVKVVKIAVVR
ncbi:T9SS type A sorting domain-containing protein [bacterium]|nr:T9SS type A sorting domain-containing protein [bacterium]